jgi:hypothetical protein
VRLEGYEIVEDLLDDAFAAPEQTPRWLARDADGTLVELATIRALQADRAPMLQRFARLQALAHPALPRVIALEGDPAVITQLVVVTAHRPRVTLAHAARAQEEGLAVALACTVAHAAARILAELDVVHGRINAWSVAIGPEGDVLLDTPSLRAPVNERDDVASLALMMCSLIAGAEEDDPDFEIPDAFEMAPAIELAPAARLAAARADVPSELLAIIGDETLDARGFADALARDLPWAQWTPMQVLDEVRAILPDEAERMKR